MPYELKLEQFSGPLEKLLELIEARQLEVTQISMAQVTDDFLRYLKALTAETAVDAADRPRSPFSSAESAGRLRLLADFVAVASRLVLIKSKYILPDLNLTEDEESGMKDLERRLKIYQELRPAIKILEKLWSAKNGELSRPFLMLRGLGTGAGLGFFYPGGNLELNALAVAMEKLFASFGDLTEETRTIKKSIVNLEEKMRDIIDRLQAGAESSFGSFTASKSRSEMIIAFLAILHLAREQLVTLEQKGEFSDIIIRRQGTSTEHGARSARLTTND